MYMNLRYIQKCFPPSTQITYMYMCVCVFVCRCDGEIAVFASCPLGGEDALYLLQVDVNEDEIQVCTFSDRDIRRVTQIKMIPDEHLIVMLTGEWQLLLRVCVCRLSLPCWK